MDCTLFLSQAEHVRKIMERFNIQDAKPFSIPLAGHFRQSKEQLSTTETEHAHKDMISYASWLVVSLMQAIMCMKLYIAHRGSCEQLHIYSAHSGSCEQLHD